ncbi:MAG: T9SS type A sorting domain-containing protein [Carboxylicivirga sp.]|jgi:hypothetical protein|nr:T9SS type A sorting domain-containing protein [Carboxylicivirga sp.]
MKKQLKKRMAMLLLLTCAVSLSYGTDWSANFNAVTYSGNARNLYFYKTALKAKYDVADEALVHRELEMGWLTGWSKGSGGFDAACYVPNGGYDVYYFAGDEYARVDENTGILEGYSSISNGWPGLANTYFQSDIDAACFSGTTERKVYLFKGDRYVSYSLETETILSNHTIAAGWPGLTDPYWQSDIESACYSGYERSIYFFKGDRYVRYNVANETIESQGTVQKGWRALLAAEAPDFNGVQWMTQAYPYIKDKKFNEIAILGSHNAMYLDNNAANVCFVQSRALDAQFRCGSRLFELRPYRESNGSWGGFHGGFCVPEKYDVIGQLTAIKNLLLGEAQNDIVIFFVSDIKSPNLSNSEVSIRAMEELFLCVFGDLIITKSEAPNGALGYTLDELLLKGNLIIHGLNAPGYDDYVLGVDDYYGIPFPSYEKDSFFGSGTKEAKNYAVAADSYLAYYYSESPNTFNILGASMALNANLRKSGYNFNKYLHDNRIKTWLNAGYSWIHKVDYVGDTRYGSDQTSNTARHFYQEAVARGIETQQNLKSKLSFISDIPEKEMSVENHTLKLWPNPTGGEDVKISYNSEVEGNATIKLYSIGGQVVLRKDETANVGNNSIIINVSDTKPGIYLVELITNNIRQTRGLIVQ